MKYLSDDIRTKYLEFFKSKEHAIIPSAPVVPENDPTVLFNTAWMQPLVPYLLGEKHPFGTRLADSQKCIRTNDIEEVGDNSHLTFFEMLGNWSLWDYFKKESIAWSWEFLTSPESLALDPRKLAVTVFEWDEDAPRDEDSAKIWEEIWMPKDRISYLWKKDNWWAAGDTGPCGPDTEIFYWVWESEFPTEWSNVHNDEDNWMEIWNNVFMEYNRLASWELINLPAQNVDTGMWLERITATLNREKTVYNTDIFEWIIKKIEEELGVKYNDETMNSIRIIADHIRTVTIMISDWVVPSNIDQWYVLRRLARRAIRQAYILGFKWTFLYNVADAVIDKLWKAYNNLFEKQAEIKEIIFKEEKQFAETLERWLKVFDKIIRTMNETDNVIDWKSAFKLFDTYGFPLEMTEELAKEHWLKVDSDWFKKAYEEHQEKSRTASAGKFKWWLADDSWDTVLLHSAAHLLLEWLRLHLWEHVHQRWSNITAERVRFDFTNDEKVDREILDKVEEFVNNAIDNWFDVSIEEMPKEQAREEWVEWSFWEKYPEVVKVYTFKWKDWKIYSRELCWWPHVEDSWEMWKFKIVKEESSSRGVRRIKAILEKK